MAALQTQPTGQSVSDFLNAIVDPQRRADCRVIARLMRAASGARPLMWGTSIVGYGKYRYKNTAGSAEWPMTGYSPRKTI